MISAVLYSGKGKIMKTVKRSIVVKVWKMKRVEQVDTKDF